MNKIKLALVGIGHVADHQLEAMRRSESVELVGAHDLNPEKRLPQDFLDRGARQYSSLGDLLAQSDAEAVFVSTGNDQHFPVAKQVLESGRDVLIEKPAASTLEEFDELCVLADQGDRRMYSAMHAGMAREVQWFVHTYLPQHSKRLGPLTGFSAGFYDPFVVQGQAPKSGIDSLGGSLTDSGINGLSVICQIVPDLQVVRANLTYTDSYQGGEVQGRIVFGFDKRYYGDIDTNWTIPRNEKATRLDYATSDTTILLHHSGQRVLRQSAAEEPEVLVTLDNVPRLPAHFLGVFDDFASCRSRGTDNREFGRKCLSLLLEAHKMGAEERTQGDGSTGPYSQPFLYRLSNLI